MNAILLTVGLPEVVATISAFLLGVALAVIVHQMVAKAKGMKEAIIDPGLKKYFPGDFNLLKKDIDDMERFMDDLDAVKKHLESVKEKVEAHLARIKEQFPFLFE